MSEYPIHFHAAVEVVSSSYTGDPRPAILRGRTALAFVVLGALERTGRCVVTQRKSGDPEYDIVSADIKNLFKERFEPSISACEIPADEYNDPKIVQSLIAHWMTDVVSITVETPSDFSGA
jgi:hypothetical protein